MAKKQATIVNPWRNKPGSTGRRETKVCAIKPLFIYLWELAMKAMISAVKRFASDEGGVTAIEYGLIASLVGVAAIVGLTQLGGDLNQKFKDIAASL
jgi:pilus assembly protein Flp/PilA